MAFLKTIKILCFHLQPAIGQREIFILDLISANISPRVVNGNVFLSKSHISQENSIAHLDRFKQVIVGGAPRRYDVKRTRRSVSLNLDYSINASNSLFFKSFATLGTFVLNVNGFIFKPACVADRLQLVFPCITSCQKSTLDFIFIKSIGAVPTGWARD